MPLVTPTPIPAYPPAPQPTDDRVTFSTKAFALASAYEPQRVSFNLAATQTNTNAAYAHERASASAQSALDASGFAATAGQKASEANAAVADVRAAMDAIQAGPVVSVNTRSGVVTGLVDQVKSLSAGTSLTAVVDSGFYRLNSGHTAAPSGVDYGSMIVSRGSDTLLRIVSSTTGDLYFQVATGVTTAGTGTATTWQRLLGDGTLIEKSVYRNSTTGAVTADPKAATVQFIQLSSNTVITLPTPRAGGDQITIKIFGAAYSYSFSSNVKLPVGASLPTLGSNEVVTLPLQAASDGNANWLLGVGPKHSML